MMKLRDQIFICVIFIFIVIGFVTNYYDKKNCGPVRTRVDEALLKLNSKNSITKLTIRNGKYGKVNEHFDSLIVDDPQTLDEIRQLVLGMKYVGLTKSSPIWTGILVFKMQDNMEFEIWLNRTEAKGDAGFKIYKYGECEESHTLGSKDLGEKILRLIEKSIGPTGTGR